MEQKLKVFLDIRFLEEFIEEKFVEEFIEEKIKKKRKFFKLLRGYLFIFFNFFHKFLIQTHRLKIENDSGRKNSTSCITYFKQQLPIILHNHGSKLHVPAIFCTSIQMNLNVIYQFS